MWKAKKQTRGSRPKGPDDEESYGCSVVFLSGLGDGVAVLGDGVAVRGHQPKLPAPHARDRAGLAADGRENRMHASDAALEAARRC